MPNDILLNEQGTAALWQNGDFVWGESTAQHQRLLLLSQKGDFKENPDRCVGFYTWLKDDANIGDVLAEVKAEFERDGMTIKNLGIDNGQLQVDASY